MTLATTDDPFASLAAVARGQDHMHDDDMGMPHTFPNPLRVACRQCDALAALTTALTRALPGGEDE